LHTFDCFVLDTHFWQYESGPNEDNIKLFDLRTFYHFTFEMHFWRFNGGLDGNNTESLDLCTFVYFALEAHFWQSEGGPDKDSTKSSYLRIFDCFALITYLTTRGRARQRQHRIIRFVFFYCVSLKAYFLRSEGGSDKDSIKSLDLRTFDLFALGAHFSDPRTGRMKTV
jgi:hypothetical protein